MAEYRSVMQKEDLSPGEGKTVMVNGRSVAIFNVEGAYYAIDNTCAHRGGPLGEGDLEGDIVTCPWHYWEYNVKTGVSPINPDVRLQTYPVRIQGSDVQVAVE
ncbi:MAG: Rieske 2Fe-2S domain-containing protein [Nitrospirae bacterium]|nr:Rieske 2Fe-2S domain-containing protein [Nitrospirota bacterium]